MKTLALVAASPPGRSLRLLAQGAIPGLTSTPITFSGHADDFVAGPDGNVWLVDSTANAIGRLAVDGSAYQAFPVPTAAAGLNSITRGPDGNLWFTESLALQGRPHHDLGNHHGIPDAGRIHFSLFGFVNGAGHDHRRPRRQPLDQQRAPDGQGDARRAR